MENLEVLLDNKVKISSNIFEKYIDDIINEQKYALRQYSSFYDYYGLSEIEFYKYIKNFIDRCIFSMGKMTYENFKKITQIGIYYENFADYGITIKDDITEVFINGICPPFLKTHKVNFTKSGTINVFKTNKSVAHLKNFIKNKSDEELKYCLEGLVRYCKSGNIKPIKYLIEDKHIIVTPEILEAYLKTSCDNIGTLLWESITESYEFIKK